MKRGFSSFHPLTCFLYYVGALVIVMLGQHPAFLLSTVLVLIVFNIIQEKGGGLIRWWGAYATLIIFFLVLTPLINHRGTHLLFYFRDNPVMLEAVIQGMITGLSLLCLLLVFLSYNQIITADKFLFLFARVLPQWALLTMLAMRFVPLFRRRLVEIDRVQQSKGVSVKTGSLKQRIKNGLLFVQILLTWSLEEGIQTADSMKARGYGLKKRSRYTPYHFQLKDGLLLVIIILFFSLSVAGWALGDLVLEIQPMLESPLLSGREWFFYVVGLLYMGIPLCIEGREWVLWRFWRYKI
ncbi:energy-coupling factor transport system permease protein [Pullulanibacillus pueri]|uniref:ABC transporter permease n=1 Tax=Pullulanibacillus pueri TaxID=1437324 RepID=A0A8J2ZSP6_9BACL|nr:energy-coupling factor transporter transmembrane component T [Pullulanibacillus pueri]MBM7680063.1 energy-coupling factor transport system permease protein [Pullulanibacillus pueri]GGH74180.1 ABC transporter permease [Pullulanibacillus pueri]